MERFAVRSKVMTLRPDGEGAAQGEAVAPQAGSAVRAAGRRPRQLARAICSARRQCGPLAGVLCNRPLACCCCLPAAGNRYVKYFRNIRAIQEYLAKSGGAPGSA